VLAAKNRAMKNPIQLKAQSSQQGVVLLEALVAILLFSMGVLALVGLQGAMMKNTDDAKLRSEASYIAQQRLGMMWADPDNVGLYVEPATTPTSISNLLPGGTRSVEINTTSGVSEVTVTINWQLPGKERHHFTTIANIAGG
jgi:type IV pilus assembly protein PilV